MKKSFLILITALLAIGCADKKAQEQSLRDSVVDMHLKVMGADEKIMNNKSALDTLVKYSADHAVIDSAKLFGDKLMLADSDMMTWMHNFQPDQTGKSHEVIMAYFGKQKRSIAHIDSQMTTLLKQSDAYLQKMKKK